MLWLGSFLQKLLDIVIPPPQRVLQKALAFLDSQIIFMSLKLGIAEALAQGPRQLDDLAIELGTSQELRHTSGPGQYIIFSNSACPNMNKCFWQADQFPEQSRRHSTKEPLVTLDQHAARNYE